MQTTNELHGFPVEIEGTKQYKKSDTWRDESVHLAALGQLLERTILDRLGLYAGDIDTLTEIVHESVCSSHLAPFLETVHAARLSDTILEVEFSAVGYPDRYIKYMHVDGPRGAYKLREAARSTDTTTERHEWYRTPERMFCIAEAINNDNEKRSRVSIALECDTGNGFRAYDDEKGIRDAEAAAHRIAGEIAE